MAAADALRGHSFALSVPGAPRLEIEETIRAHAGTISNTVHARVDYLIATPTAIARNTQAVRKARGKFGIAVVTPSFVDEWVRTSAAPDTEAYAPTRDTDERKPAKATVPPAVAALSATTRIWVSVEMADPPSPQRWPARLCDAREVPPGALASVPPPPGGWSGGEAACATWRTIAYGPLPSRGYDSEACTPRAHARRGPVPLPSWRTAFHPKLVPWQVVSLARVELSAPGSALGDVSAGRLYDCDEEVWREWGARGDGEASGLAEGGEASSEMASSVSVDARPDCDRDERPRGTVPSAVRCVSAGRRARRPWPPLFCAFRSTSAARAFLRARRRLIRLGKAAGRGGGRLKLAAASGHRRPHRGGGSVTALPRQPSP